MKTKATEQNIFKSNGKYYKKSFISSILHLLFKFI